MEYLIIGLFMLLCVFVGFYISVEYVKALERSNDKLKATLVKKDLYIDELEKQVEFYIEITNPNPNGIKTFLRCQK